VEYCGISGFFVYFCAVYTNWSVRTDGQNDRRHLDIVESVWNESLFMGEEWCVGVKFLELSIGIIHISSRDMIDLPQEVLP